MFLPGLSRLCGQRAGTFGLLHHSAESLKALVNETYHSEPQDKDTLSKQDRCLPKDEYECGGVCVCVWGGSYHTANVRDKCMETSLVIGLRTACSNSIQS